MTDFNNKKLLSLIKEFGWKEGANAHFYFHPQDRRKEKPLLTKKAVAELSDARGFTPVDAKVQEVAGRVAVTGIWTCSKTHRKVWTTGEADPTGKAVEGSHPVAMAEKRWKARGVIALECGEGSGIYSEEEFSKDYLDEARKGSKAPAPAPAQENDRNEWWASGCAAIAEATGQPRGKFEEALWQHCTARHAQGRYWLPVDLAKTASVQVGRLSDLHAVHRDWSGTTYGQLREVREALKGGSPVALMVPAADRENLEEALVLHPTASGGSAAPSATEDGDS